MNLNSKQSYFFFLTSMKRLYSTHPFILYFNQNEKYKKITKNFDHNSTLNNQLNDCLSNNPIHENLLRLDWVFNQNGSKNLESKLKFENIRSHLSSSLNHLNKEDLLKLLYLYSVFSTFYKNDVKEWKELDLLTVKFIENLENFLNDFNLIDLSIFCDSLFKLKFKLNQKEFSMIIENVKGKSLEKNLKSYQLVIFSKFIRINSYFNQDDINFIINQIIAAKDDFKFAQICHILALFANFAYYDADVIDNLSQKGFNCLKKEASKDINNIRCKDVSRFIWSFAFLNHQIQDLDYILDYIIPKISSQFFIYPHFLLDCLKSSIILGKYPLLLIDLFLSNSNFLEKLSKIDKNKISQDLYFILESIKIEEPNFKLEKMSKIIKLIKSPVKHNLKMINRTNFFKSVYLSLKKKGQVEIVYPLEHFSLASLSFNGKLYEIFDSYVCLRNVNYKPSGLLNCKMRQMALKNISFQLIRSLNKLDYN